MEPEPENRFEAESRRLADLLGRLVRLSGRSVRSIERQMGAGSSSLGKVLQGGIRLQVEHLLMILDALGITPAQFFQIAYLNKDRTKPHPLLAELVRREGQPATEEIDPQQIEVLVRRALRDLLGKALREDEPAAPEQPAP